METTDSKYLIPVPIASEAASGNVTVIPATQAEAGDGRFSVALGYPAECAISVTAGGKFPQMSDANGAYLLVSSAIRALQAFNILPYDATFAQSIGGYPAGAIVSGSVAGTFWVSTSESNVSVPGATGATWQSLFNGVALLSGAAFSGPVYTPNPTDVPGENTGTRVATTYWVDKYFTPRTLAAAFVTGTGTGGNVAVSNVQVRNAPTGDTVSAVLQVQTSWGQLLIPSSLNVASQVEAVEAKLPLPTDMHVQVFTTIIPVGTPCGYNGSPYVIPLPKPFTSFVGALGGDGGANIFTLSCAPNDNSHVNVWCQSPQYPNGPTAGNVSIIITAYGYY